MPFPKFWVDGRFSASGLSQIRLPKMVSDPMQLWHNVMFVYASVFTLYWAGNDINPYGHDDISLSAATHIVLYRVEELMCHILLSGLKRSEKGDALIWDEKFDVGGEIVLTEEMIMQQVKELCENNGIDTTDLSPKRRKLIEYWAAVVCSVSTVDIMIREWCGEEHIPAFEKIINSLGKRMVKVLSKITETQLEKLREYSASIPMDEITKSFGDSRFDLSCKAFEENSEGMWVLKDGYDSDEE